MGVDLGIGVERRHLGADERCQRRLPADFARHAHAGAQDFQIVLDAEKILLDAHRRARIGGGKRRRCRGFAAASSATRQANESG